MPFVRLGTNPLGIDPDAPVDLDASRVQTSDTGADLVIVYHTQRDNRVRPSHAALEGRVWELDDPASPAPPLGYGCRCFVEIVKRTKTPAEPPKSEAAALKRFPDLEQNVERYMGREIAALYAKGDLKASDLLTDSGDPIDLTQARAIVAARKAATSQTAAVTAVAELNGMGLDDRAIARIAKAAQGRIAGGTPPAEAIRAELALEARTGVMASRSKAVRDSRIDRAAQRFMASRLLTYEAPAKLLPKLHEGAPRAELVGPALITSLADQVIAEVAKGVALAAAVSLIVSDPTLRAAVLFELARRHVDGAEIQP